MSAPEPAAAAPRNLLKALGPGLIFAGTAVGVSHLVQSTRAGASFGFSLLLVLIAANLFKYPAFQAGPRYAAATGTSLLEGYRRQGSWALIFFGVVTLLTMSATLAAIVMTNAGLTLALFGWKLSATAMVVILLAICAAINGVGRYTWLDGVMKVVMLVLTVSTVVAALLILPRIDWSIQFAPVAISVASLTFIAGFIGWMPSAIEVAAWHSLWTISKKSSSAYEPTMAEALWDNNVGYLGTVLLALCFLILGAGVMFHSGVTPEEKAVAFATQIIALYTTALGEWTRPIIGTAAMLTMFSTTLSVVDGYPRVLNAIWDRLRGGEESRWSEGNPQAEASYWIGMVLLIAGAIVIVAKFAASLLTLVDFITTVAFCTAPVLSWLNYKAMTGPEVPAAARYSPSMNTFTIVCIVVQGAFAVFYLAFRFGLLKLAN